MSTIKMIALSLAVVFFAFANLASASEGSASGGGDAGAQANRNTTIAGIGTVRILGFIPKPPWNVVGPSLAPDTWEPLRMVRFVCGGLTNIGPAIPSAPSAA